MKKIFYLLASFHICLYIVEKIFSYNGAFCYPKSYPDCWNDFYDGYTIWFVKFLSFSSLYVNLSCCVLKVFHLCKDQILQFYMLVGICLQANLYQVYKKKNVNSLIEIIFACMEMSCFFCSKYLEDTCSLENCPMTYLNLQWCIIGRDDL